MRRAIYSFLGFIFILSLASALPDEAGTRLDFSYSSAATNYSALNVSDANTIQGYTPSSLPISSATQTALDSKINTDFSNMPSNINLRAKNLTNSSGVYVNSGKQIGATSSVGFAGIKPSSEEFGSFGVDIVVGGANKISADSYTNRFYQETNLMNNTLKGGVNGASLQTVNGQDKWFSSPFADQYGNMTIHPILRKLYDNKEREVANWDKGKLNVTTNITTAYIEIEGKNSGYNLLQKWGANNYTTAQIDGQYMMFQGMFAAALQDKWGELFGVGDLASLFYGPLLYGAGAVITGNFIGAEVVENTGGFIAVGGTNQVDYLYSVQDTNMGVYWSVDKDGNEVTVGNITADNFIDTSHVWDTTKDGKALDKIKADTFKLNSDGEINHSRSFEFSFATYKKREIIGYRNVSIIDKQKTTATKNVTKEVTIPIYVEVEKEGYNMGKELALYKEAIYELKQDNIALRYELCNAKPNTYTFCGGLA